MRVTSYTQLDAEALTLLNARLDHHKGSRAALARELGLSRSGISQALDGKYPGSTANLRARIFDMLAGQVTCPHTGNDIAPSACKATRERPLSAASASRDDAKQWQACQRCRFNPAAKREGDAS